VICEEPEYGDLYRQRSKESLGKPNYSVIYESSHRPIKKKKIKIQEAYEFFPSPQTSAIGPKGGKKFTARNPYFHQKIINEVRNSEESPREAINSIRQLPQIFGSNNTRAVDFGIRRADSRLASRLPEESAETPSFIVQENDGYSYYKHMY
jgi:hypothetical protein